MTELLYYQDAYLKEFEATVLECSPTVFQGREAFDIVLDRTAFFPEQGGQDADSGVIRGTDTVNVQYVSIRNDIIHHICDKAVSAGTQIKGTINWEQRFDRMQQHSGEHLVSGTVHRFCGADNVGFHLSEREVTLDFNTTFEEADLDWIEDTVNRAIYENFATVISFPSAEELASIDYRSKKELKGQVRIVEYPGYDICACCAPHVARTGEIGCIRIAAAEHFKGGTRMWIECGGRALRSARALLKDAKSISRITSAKLSEIVPAVNKMSDALKDARFELVRLERINLAAMAEAVANEANPLLVLESADSDNIRLVLNELAEKSQGYCTALIGNDEKGYRFITISKNKNCRELMDRLKAVFNIKGGGTPEMIQGTINAVVEEIKKNIL